MSWRKNRMRDLQKNAWLWGINNGFVIDEKIYRKPMEMICAGFYLSERVFCPKGLRTRQKRFDTRMKIIIK